MRAPLDGIITAQGGIFRRSQAIGAGYSNKEFALMAEPGHGFVRVRYGVYTTREIWQLLGADARQRLRDRGTLLRCNDQAVLSHSSAANELGLPVYGVTDALSHVTRLGGRQSFRVQSGVKHHVAMLDASEWTVAQGWRVTTAIRTATDMAREYGYAPGLVVADAALHAGASKAALLAYAESLSTEPGGPVIAAVARDAEPLTQSPHETLSRILLVNIGITDLQPQRVFVFAAGGRAEVDFYSPGLNHVFEADGRVKYQDQLDGYGNTITAREVVWLEKKREDKVRGLGVGFSRIYAADTRPENLGSASERIWGEISRQHGQSVRRPPAS